MIPFSGEGPISPRPDGNGFVGRNLRRASESWRLFRVTARTEGANRALADLAFAFRFYVFERSDWLVDRFGLKRGRLRSLGRCAPSEPLRDGVLCIGYVEAGLGLGESLRGLIRALSKRPLRLAIWPFRLGVETRLIGPFMPERYDRRHAYKVNLLEMAVDQLPHLENAFGSERLKRSYNVLRTYWELPEAPSSWAANLSAIDEIWAPTEFVADAFRPIFSGPIVLVPPCVDVAADRTVPFDRCGLIPDRFYFLFSFDTKSRVERKNPLGVLEAWQAAFGGSNEDVGLVVKIVGPPDEEPAIRTRLREAAAADERIVVVDEALPRTDMLALLRSCRCYVSLHRSEGFGLGMAEALAFGNTVIGTDFSGSKAFLNEDTGFPVHCRLRPVRPGEYPFADGQLWAEPDIDAASDAMRLVFTDESLRTAKGQAGQALISERFGPTAVGDIAEARLREILRSTGRRSSPTRSGRRGRGPGCPERESTFSQTGIGLAAGRALETGSSASGALPRQAGSEPRSVSAALLIVRRTGIS